MLANIGLYSYGTALLTFSLLSLILLLNKGRNSTRLPAMTAALLTATWAGIVVASSLQSYPLVNLIKIAEVIRNAAWLFLLLKMIGSRLADTQHILATNRWIPWFIVSLLLVLGVQFLPQLLPDNPLIQKSADHNLTFAIWLVMAVTGLLLLEQIFRNSTQRERWSVKHLCLGLGLIFMYDFFMYAEGLLFRQLDANLWQARGFVTAFSALFISVAVARIERSDSDSRVYMSRHVVFHSVTLLAAGIYLLMMSLAGYFIQYMGGSWGGVLQIAFLIAAGLLLLVLLFSGQIRAKLRVWLSKNFFSYKYDYRVEWLQFTQKLAEGGDNIPENIIQAIANFTKSPGGMLWHRTENGQFVRLTTWGMAEPEIPDQLGSLPQWMERSEWIIDLKEWQHSPDLYDDLVIPEFIEQLPRAWLIVPLMFGTQLQGILMLRESDLQPELNWEDRDLLKVAGRQAATHLAQYQANQALVKSRQFEAFNRLSAYVVHDLKNILAQQSLIVANAEKHRNNQDFVDDVIKTVANSVKRMTRLMEQMRSGVRGNEYEAVELGELLREVIDERGKSPPNPSIEACQDDLIIMADRVQLATVFNHIIQNAQEATGKAGNVAVRMSHDGSHALVEIEDDGIGMSEQFLRNRLFKPFESTKGLTGMGIGAFESREFIRALGGDIRVQSTPGHGSVFIVEIPSSTAVRMEEQASGKGR